MYLYFYRNTCVSDTYYLNYVSFQNFYQTISFSLQTMYIFDNGHYNIFLLPTHIMNLSLSRLTMLQKSVSVRVSPLPSVPVRVRPLPSAPVRVRPLPLAPVRVSPMPSAPVRVRPCSSDAQIHTLLYYWPRKRKSQGLWKR